MQWKSITFLESCLGSLLKENNWKVDPVNFMSTNTPFNVLNDSMNAKNGVIDFLTYLCLQTKCSSD